MALVCFEEVSIVDGKELRLSLRVIVEVVEGKVAHKATKRHILEHDCKESVSHGIDVDFINKISPMASHFWGAISFGTYKLFLSGT